MSVESDQEEIQHQDEAVSSPQGSKNPALTVVIQSWTTPIVGIIMLVVGLLAGYYGRPLLSDDQPTRTTGVESTLPDEEIVPTANPTQDAERAAQQEAVMASLTAGVRHFKGSPDAPVTIIEFSDFQ